MLSLYYIKQTADIGDAIRSIKANSTRTVLIVNEQLKVLGVLSQGDILEHISYGATMNLSASSIMNRNFVFYSSGDAIDENRVKNDFKQGKLLIPVLSEEGTLESVVSIFDYLD